MIALEPLSRLISRLHEEGASYETILRDVAADGFSRTDIMRAYVLATYPHGIRRTLRLSWIRCQKLFAPIALVGITIAAVGGILVTAQEPPIVYPLYVTPNGDRTPVQFSYGPDASFADTTYFQTVKRNFIEQRASFVSANLETKVIEVFKEGEMVLTVPIATKGRPGSWWETPAGIYQIETKEEKHRSGISGVYQPYSMRFQGNFYVHGWPYHPNGERVSSAYSGGCIRLQDEDAIRLYEVASVGMPLIVFEHEQTLEKKVFARSAPQVSAESYSVIDAKSGFVFSERKTDAILPISGIVKMFTALVTSEYINVDATIAVPAHALAQKENSRLKPGQKVRVYDLLYPLLLESSDDAARTLASVLGKEKFVAMMNKKAASLGMRDTRLVDVTGQSDGSVSTVSDLYQLALYLSENRSFLLNLTAGRIEKSAYGDIAFSNIMLPQKDDASYRGGVSVRAGEGVQSTFGMYVVTLGGEERTVFISLLNTSNSQEDIEKLKRFLSVSYE